jgi:hypothetical protein
MHIIKNSFFNKAMLLGFALFIAALSMQVFAETRYQTVEAFLSDQFQDVPKPAKLWLVKDRAKQAKKILGHQPDELRQTYWKQGNKTVWILNEIGKTEPITAGFVVEDGKIILARVLVYRESRGGEVHYPAFLKQYDGAQLDQDYFLDRSIDGISGATLSVRSMSRMARLALYYDALTNEE